MDPAFITIRMFNVNPAVFAFKNLKGYPLFNREKYGVTRTGARADIGGVFSGYHRRNLAHKRPMHPSFVAFEILKTVPFAGFFNHKDRKKLLHLP